MQVNEINLPPFNLFRTPFKMRQWGRVVINFAGMHDEIVEWAQFTSMKIYFAL